MSPRDVSYPDAKSSSSFRDGAEFAEFARDLMLERLGWWPDIYRSKHFQFNVGESRQGVEFKLDNRCTETGRLSIEVAEKSHAGMPDWTPSGIMRQDNTILYVQGNAEALFIFAKSFLLAWHDKNKPRIVENTPTIRSFFLPLDIARKFAVYVIDVNPAAPEEVPF